MKKLWFSKQELDGIRQSFQAHFSKLKPDDNKDKDNKTKDKNKSKGKDKWCNFWKKPPAEGELMTIVMTAVGYPHHKSLGGHKGSDCDKGKKKNEDKDLKPSPTTQDQSLTLNRNAITVDAVLSSPNAGYFASYKERLWYDDKDSG